MKEIFLQMKYIIGAFFSLYLGKFLLIKYKDENSYVAILAVIVCLLAGIIFFGQFVALWISNIKDVL